MNGSKPFSMNLSDARGAITVFLATFLPILAYNVLQNMEQLEAIAITYLESLGMPEWALLLVIPVVASLFATIVLFLKNNAKK